MIQDIAVVSHTPVIRAQSAIYNDYHEDRQWQRACGQVSPWHKLLIEELMKAIHVSGPALSPRTPDAWAQWRWRYC